MLLLFFLVRILGRKSLVSVEKLPQLQIRQWLRRANIVDVIACDFFSLQRDPEQKREEHGSDANTLMSR